MTCVLLNKTRDEDAQGIPASSFSPEASLNVAREHRQISPNAKQQLPAPIWPSGSANLLLRSFFILWRTREYRIRFSGMPGRPVEFAQHDVPWHTKSWLSTQLISPREKHSSFISLGGDVLVLQGCFQSQRALQCMWKAHNCSTGIFNGWKWSQIPLFAMEKVQCMWKVPAAPLLEGYNKAGTITHITFKLQEEFWLH